MKIKRIFLFFFSFIFFSFIYGCSSYRSRPVDKFLSFKLRKEFKRLDYIKFKADNGLTVYYKEDRGLPIVKASIFIPGGSLSESEGSFGSYQALAYMLRNGGGGKYSPSGVEERLFHLATDLNISWGGEYGEISLSSLSEVFSDAFDLVIDILTFPKFDQDTLNLWKLQIKDDIVRKGNDPNALARIALNMALFSDSSYGHNLTFQDIDKISRISLLRLHRKVVLPNKAYLIISGNISLDEVKRILKKAGKFWKKRQDYALPSVKLFKGEAKKGIYFIKKDNLTQSTVYLGQLGPARLAPEWPSIVLFNALFGDSGFSSLLMKRLRTEGGLVYWAGGGIFQGKNLGQSLVAFQCSSDKVYLAVSDSLKVLSDIQLGKISDKDLELAKQAKINSFIFNFDTPFKYLKREVLLLLLSYPVDYNTSYISNISRVSLKDITSTVRKYIDLREFAVVVVGDDIAYNHNIKKLRETFKDYPVYVGVFQKGSINFKRVSDKG